MAINLLFLRTGGFVFQTDPSARSSTPTERRYQHGGFISSATQAELRLEIDGNGGIPCISVTCGLASWHRLWPTCGGGDSQSSSDSRLGVAREQGAPLAAGHCRLRFQYGDLQAGHTVGSFSGGSGGSPRAIGFKRSTSPLAR